MLGNDGSLAAEAEASHLQQGAINLWHAVAFSPSTEISNELLQKSKSIDVEKRTFFGYTHILCAVFSGNKINVENLLRLKPNLDAKHDQADVVLHMTCSSGNLNVLRLLQEAALTLNLNARNSQSKTPLLLAAAKRHHACVATLLELGAKADIRDESDQTLLYHVAPSGRVDILALLKLRNVASISRQGLTLAERPLCRRLSQVVLK